MLVVGPTREEATAVVAHEPSRNPEAHDPVFGLSILTRAKKMALFVAA
jgi:hypothetical protein